ncbi:glycosyltransferase family 2 protein [Paenibacillus ferrarius]|uniref:glycosyltransferase family 2 protein n=1 Tax=Paenibacillus ferrarius TaxID=1469647 RepID=UPI003D2BFBFD
MFHEAGAGIVLLGVESVSVSVHIVTYNSSEHIEACLEALMIQTCQADEIVIVDNQSKDDTLAQLERWRSQCKIIINAQNKGFAGAHNQAIRGTDTDYCLILNPDVVLDRDYIKRIIEALERNPEAGSATGKLLFKSDPSQIDSTGLTINKTRRAFDRGAHEPSERYEQTEEVFGVSGAAAMYKRAMINDISVNGEFFDEDFFAYKEDVDVAWRAQLRGWKAIYEPMAIAYHERGWKEGGRRSKPLFVRRLSYINRYKMIWKNDRSSQVMKHVIPIFIYEAVSLGYALLCEPKLLKAWSSFFRKLPELKEKRKLIQTKRKAADPDIYKWFI